jgi:hypothetical protein
MKTVPLALSVVSALLLATSFGDTVTYKLGNDSQGRKQDIIVKHSDTDRVEFWELHPDGYVILNYLHGAMVFEEGSPSGFEVNDSSIESRLRIIGLWKGKTGSALVQRKHAPDVELIAPAIRFPLPPNVNYLFGSPKQQTGTAIYLGKDFATANQIPFNELTRIDIQGNGKKARVIWLNGHKENAPILDHWDYDGRPGSTPVLFGFRQDNASFFEIELSSVSRISFVHPK